MKRLGSIWTQVDAIVSRDLSEGRQGHEELEIRGIAFDSREIEEGMLFVALTGAEQDGHAYLEAARQKGASAVLVEVGRAIAELGIPVLEASDTRAVLGRLAAYFYDEPSQSLHVIGITGTNGKTTTSFLLEEIFKAQKISCGVVGTINYRWPGVELAAANTTPESLVLQKLMARMVGDGVENLVMEVSSHGLATHRLEGTAFDVAIFTNLTQDHLDFHETMEAYRDAKRRLFLEHLPRASKQGKKPLAIVNIDDAEGQALAQLLEHEQDVSLMTYAIGNDRADYHCLEQTLTVDGAKLTVATPTGHLKLRTPMLGEFNVSNTLAAVAAAIGLGVKQESISRGLGSSTGVPGRLERVDGRARPAVFVDYAHTPDALERALETLRPHAAGKLVVVFGCGGERDRAKRPQMGAIAARLADEVILTSDNPRREDPMVIIDDIRRGAPEAPVTIEPDRRRAIALAISRASAQDVILLAGKGHENYQEIDGLRRRFDDAEQARTALAKRGDTEPSP